MNPIALARRTGLAVLASGAALSVVSWSEVRAPQSAYNSFRQPPQERALQDKLPQARGPVWTQLMACRVRFDDRNGLYSIRVTPEVRALAGRQVTLQGFVLPLDGSDRPKLFLLTRRTPTCFFCPPGEPNEYVEVLADRATPWTERMITVTGTLQLVDDREKGVFFRLVGARQV